ncbi:MAG: hypothetical protein U0802_00650 [Candidatus Binatia bacterium]
MIRGSQGIEQRPFGSQATIQRLGIDLRQIDRRYDYNIVSLTVETGNYLKTVMDMLDTPDIGKAFDANTSGTSSSSSRSATWAASARSRSARRWPGRHASCCSTSPTSPSPTRDFTLFQAQVQPLGPVAGMDRRLPDGARRARLPRCCSRCAPCWGKHRDARGLSGDAAVFGGRSPGLAAGRVARAPPASSTRGCSSRASACSSSPG